MIDDKENLHTKYLYPNKTIREFNDDIDFILKHFTPIDLATLLSYINNKHPLPHMSLHLTFDDGFSQMHDVVAPILLAKGIPATFFINSGFVDNKILCYQHKASIIVGHLQQKNISDSTTNHINKILSGGDCAGGNIISRVLAVKYHQKDILDQIAEALSINFEHYLRHYKPYMTTRQIQKMLADGFTFGAHSIDHPLYSTLSLQHQIHQTTESMRFVKNTFKLNYGAFAFPHSDLGVSKTYFDEIKKTELVDISFGTAGLIEDCVENNIQRFSLEKPLLPAKNIFSTHSAKRLWRILSRTNKIKRHSALC